MPSAPAETLVRPAFSSPLEYAYTLGPEVADLATLAGFPPDPEQRWMLDRMFAYGPNRRLAAFEVATICPRQNMKTGLLKMAALGWLFLTGEKLVVWSSQQFSTSKEAFRDILALIQSVDDFDKEVVNVATSTGNEGIELTGDRRLLFKARTKSGVRGLTGDRVVLDEALFLSSHHMGALLPTLSARPDPQVLYASSAGVADSDVLRRVRNRGRAGQPSRLAYDEWCDPEGPSGCAGDYCTHEPDAEGCALDDRGKLAAANPQAGRRIAWETIMAERAAMPPEEFARERLGWWDEPAAADAVFTGEEWTSAQTDDAPDDPLIAAVDVSPAHTWATVVVCGANGVLEVAARHRGSSWLPEKLAGMADAHGITEFAIDPAGPIGSLIPELERAGVPLRLLDGRDAVDACGAFAVAIRDLHVRHRGEKALTEAVAGASRRPVGDGWKWSRRDSTVDISPLVAATYANWCRVDNTGAPIEPSLFFV